MRNDPNTPATAWFRLLWAVLLVLATGSAGAQDFSVRSFRMLSNDITAYIAPVRDLNNEACALVKVVGDPDFVFSSPLGVVKRKNEVGEIWLYLPAGSLLLTIKHPQWGVLRDYRFSAPLESRMTYELWLTPPLDYRRPKEMPALSARPCPLDTSLHVAGRLPEPAPPRPRRPRERLHGLAMLNVGLNADRPSAGLRLALMRRHGAYLLAQTDFHSTPHTQGECDSNGQLPNGETPYYTGQTRQGRWMLLAGGIHRVAGDFCVYEGIGYGQRLLAWKLNEGSWTRNADHTYRGLCAEAGGLYRFYRIAVSAGVMTIQGKYWEAAIGIGWHF